MISDAIADMKLQCHERSTHTLCHVVLLTSVYAVLCRYGLNFSYILLTVHSCCQEA